MTGGNLNTVVLEKGSATEVMKKFLKNVDELTGHHGSDYRIKPRTSFKAEGSETIIVTDNKSVSN